MTRKLIEIAAAIVQSQASSSQMSPEDIVSSLQKVFRTLQEMEKSERTGTPLDVAKSLEEAATAGVAPKKFAFEESIQQDKIVCLECKAEMKQLTARHLASHGLNPKHYKKKYGFSMKTPLSAKALTKARSKAAKKRGLPEKLVQYLEAKKAAKGSSGGAEKKLKDSGPSLMKN